MSKLVLIAAVALDFAGRGAAADRAVAQVIKSKAAEAFARARAGGAAGPEKAERQREQISRRLRAESSRRPPRHRRDVYTGQRGGDYPPAATAGRLRREVLRGVRLLRG